MSRSWILRGRISGASQCSGDTQHPQPSLPTLSPVSVTPAHVLQTPGSYPSPLSLSPHSKGSAVAGPPSGMLLLVSAPGWKLLTTQISLYCPLSMKPPPNILLKMVLLPCTTPMTVYQIVFFTFSRAPIKSILFFTLLV